MPIYDMFKDVFSFISKKRYKYKYIWQNKDVINDKVAYDDISKPSEYKITYKFNFEKGEFELTPDGQVIEIKGYDALIQSITKFFLTGKDKYQIYSSAYGVSFNLLNATDKDEFGFMSEAVAKEVIDFFPDFIVDIAYIKKLRLPKNRIEVGLKLKSNTEIDRVEIDLSKKI